MYFDHVHLFLLFPDPLPFLPIQLCVPSSSQSVVDLPGITPHHERRMVSFSSSSYLQSSLSVVGTLFWDSDWLELVKVLCTLLRLLHAHVSNSPVVFRKHCFLVVQQPTEVGPLHLDWRSESQAYSCSFMVIDKKFD